MALLIAVLLFTTIFSVNAKLKEGQIEENCLKEVGIEREVYDDAMEQNLQNADTKIKCMTKCLVKSYELMKPDGTINIEKVADGVFNSRKGSEEEMKILEECSKTQEDECETGYRMITCVNLKLKGIGSAF